MALTVFMHRGSCHGIAPGASYGAAYRSLLLHVLDFVLRPVELVPHGEASFLRSGDLPHGALLHHCPVVSVLLQLLPEPCIYGVGFVEAVEEVVVLPWCQSIRIAFVRHEVSCFFAHLFDCWVFFIPRVVQNPLGFHSFLREQHIRLHGGSSNPVILDFVHLPAFVLERASGLEISFIFPPSCLCLSAVG